MSRTENPDGLLAVGQVLIASPSLADPNFVRTIVLLLDVDEGGALGVVLNRPTETEVADVAPQWQYVGAGAGLVHAGGPVEPEGVIALAQLAEGAPQPPGWRPVVGSLGLADLDEDSSNLDRVRLYAGYAGWGAGQLEGEIAQGAWFVATPTPGELFALDPDQLWMSLLRRQPEPIALMATMPADASNN